MRSTAQMKTMARIKALCTCLLLLGVLPGNIQCSDNVTGTHTDSTPGYSSSSIPADAPSATDHDSTNTELNSTVALPTQLATNHTDNSSTTPSTIPPSSGAPPRPTINSTAPGGRVNTGSTGAPKTSPPSSPAGTTKTTPTGTVLPTKPPQRSKAGYIVLGVFIVVAVILVIVCCCKQNKSRKYSIELSNKHEEAVIPLSTVEADAVFDATPEKELETFTAHETSATSQEPTAPAPTPDPDPEPKKGESEAGEEKATGAETSGSKDPLTTEKELEKMEVVDINDGEPTISTKTSIESLEDQLNDNNSNSYYIH